MSLKEMNLSVLQQTDPNIAEILDCASDVSLYLYNGSKNQWEVTGVEGTLFVFARSESPINGFMVLNKKGLKNVVQPVANGLKVHRQDQFILYQNHHDAPINGVWFPSVDECNKIELLVNNLLRAPVAPKSRQSKIGRHAEQAAYAVVERDRHTSSSEPGAELLRLLGGQPGNQDALQLCKDVPKPLIDNPNAGAIKQSSLIRPTPLKPGATQAEQTTNHSSEAVSINGHSINIDELFNNAQQRQSRNTPDSQVNRAGKQLDPQSVGMLQRLLSDPGLSGGRFHSGPSRQKHDAKHQGQWACSPVEEGPQFGPALEEESHCAPVSAALGSNSPTQPLISPHSFGSQLPVTALPTTSSQPIAIANPTAGGLAARRNTSPHPEALRGLRERQKKASTSGSDVSDGFVSPNGGSQPAGSVDADRATLDLKQRLRIGSVSEVPATSPAANASAHQRKSPEIDAITGRAQNHTVPSPKPSSPVKPQQVSHSGVVKDSSAMRPLFTLSSNNKATPPIDREYTVAKEVFGLKSSKSTSSMEVMASSGEPGSVAGFGQGVPAMPHARPKPEALLPPTAFLQSSSSNTSASTPTAEKNPTPTSQEPWLLGCTTSTKRSPPMSLSGDESSGSPTVTFSADPLSLLTHGSTCSGSGSRSASVSGPFTGSQTSSSAQTDKGILSDAKLATLTKEQLQQALIYMIKNDEAFMSNLHQAYVQSMSEYTKSK